MNHPNLTLPNRSGRRYRVVREPIGVHARQTWACDSYDHALRWATSLREAMPMAEIRIELIGVTS